MGIQERKQKIFYRKTKKGNIIKVVREHYMRDDIWCGLNSCEMCKGDKNSLTVETSSESSLISKAHHLLIDTNIAIHQIDLLCQEVITNVIIPQTVMQEVRHRSLPIYKRLRDLIETDDKHFFVFSNEHHGDCYVEREAKETANDRNDRAIRVACWWYQQHFNQMGQSVVLLTNDIAHRDKARESELNAYTAVEYVGSLTKHPELLDIVAQMEEDQESEQNSDSRFFYSPHSSITDVRTALKTEKLCQGVLKMSRNNYLQGNIMVQGKEEKNILIQGRMNLNRALHDDVVAVEILPQNEWVVPSNVVIDQEKEEEDKDTSEDTEDSVMDKENALLASGVGSGERQITGKIVAVVRRKWRQYCGIIKKNDYLDSTRHTFIPAEKRIPFIRIETRQAAALLNKRIIVAIDSWPRDSRYPKGHFVRTIGEIGDKETENEVILLEHDCPHTKFSESVLNCLPKLPWVITKEDEAMREDLRHIDICSVDPVGCTDIDDALHCRLLENGNFEVGVHIADVSHFIRPNTAIDMEAQNRSTSVYLTNRRIDMVPELLSSNLCSLRGDVDRFAFSVLWEVTPEGETLSSKFCKSIIKSRAELTYQEAQQRIDDPSINDDLTKSLRNLNAIAKHLKRKRVEAGALVLASMEVKFHIDPDTDTVVDIVAKQHLETMSMVEEFMLLANVTAAETTVEHFPDCALIRRHPAPPASNFENLLIAAESQNVDIDVTSNKTLADSLDKANRDDNPFFNSMLRIMTTRSMMQAVYFCSGTLERPEYYHYGLATDCYTHFTSPIRRYADIIVHRLLAVFIERDTTYPELLDPKKCSDLTNHINYRHKMAQYASRGSSVVTAISSLRGKTCEYDAYILFLLKNAIQVLIPTIGQQLTIYLDTHIKEMKKRNKAREIAKRAGAKDVEPLENEEDLPQFEFNEKGLVLRCGKVEVRPFDQLRVQITVDSSDVQHEKVVTKLVMPKIKGFSVPTIEAPLRAATKLPKFKKLKTK